MLKAVTDLYHILQQMRTHPLTRASKASAIGRLVSWQIAKKSVKVPLVLPFISDTRLIVSSTVPGSASTYYFGVTEFEIMALVLHYLRAEDLFGDVGANVGSWTVAVSGVARARAVAIEPSPMTYGVLTDNIMLNRLSHLVRPIQAGAGAEAGKLRISEGLGVENRIVTDKSGLEVDILPLNDIFHEVPDVLKVDVEGFEEAVIRGASRLIRDPKLRIVVIEDVGRSSVYGFDFRLVHQELVSAGFNTYDYDVGSRSLTEVHTRNPGNLIYIRDVCSVRDRVTEGRRFSVLGTLF